MVRSIKLSVSAVALGLILAACASAAPKSPTVETVTVTASTQASSPLSGMQEYSSVQALADDLSRYGAKCDVTPLANDFALQSGECDTEIGRLKLSVYLSQEKLQEQLDFVKELGVFGPKYGWIVGSRWSVDCGKRIACESIKSKIGGIISANS